MRDWRNPSEYPKPTDLDATGWAWEFLRRNPDYQRLWDIFDALPDYLELEDERGPFSYSKHGKWKGTPNIDFRFLTDGAGWYADPEPIPGEHVSEYEARCPEGRVLPFADYLMARFRLLPYPIAPAAELTEAHGFSDTWGDDSEAPWFLNLSPPPAELVEAYPETYASELAERMAAIDREPAKVPILFDLRQPIEAQLKEAKEMLRYAAEEQRWRTQWGEKPFTKESRPHFRPREHARHIRLLDAAAAGATLEEIAATLHPREANTYDTGFRVTKRLREQMRQAERLRDGDYWRFPTRSFANKPE
jgi:hypothetical protein